MTTTFETYSISGSASGSNPWDAYNASDDFLSVLAAHGYQTVQATGNKTTFTPPGGSRKERAQVVFYHDKRVLLAYCDDTPFQKSKGYDPTAVFAILEHAGDRREACRVLLEQGFGERDTERKPAFKSSAPELLPPSSPYLHATPSLLSDAHRAHLIASAIAPEIIAQRGYETVRDPVRLRALGFSAAQSQNVPGILIPYKDAFGEQFYQYRPDRPRPDGPKYETPPGKPGRYGLDIPAACREELLHGTGEVWCGEGSKKGDAGASVGLCMFVFAGVWMFLCENEQGKKAMLRDFDIIPLQARTVILCYDSDAMTKPSVYAALRRLANGLRRRGANVRFCYLPDDGETKTGLDDYLAQGHTVEDLRALCEDTLRPIATAPVQCMVDDLNRRFGGVAMFASKRAHLREDAEHSETLSAIKAVFSHQGGFTEECRYLAGDMCARLKFPHGEKMKEMEKAFGEGNAKNAQKWAVPIRKFSGDRDYFRDAMPLTLLQIIAAYSPDAQDALLMEYLTAKESGKQMTGKDVRARIRELDGLPVSKEENAAKGEHLSPNVQADALQMQALVRLMPPDTLTAFHALQDEQGQEIANKMLAAQIPAMLTYGVQKAREFAAASNREYFNINASPIYIEREYDKSDREAGGSSEPMPADAPPPELALLTRPVAPAEHMPRHLTALADVLTGDPTLRDLAALARRETDGEPTLAPVPVSPPVYAPISNALIDEERQRHRAFYMRDAATRKHFERCDAVNQHIPAMAALLGVYESMLHWQVAEQLLKLPTDEHKRVAWQEIQQETQTAVAQSENGYLRDAEKCRIAKGVVKRHTANIPRLREKKQVLAVSAPPMPSTDLCNQADAPLAADVEPYPGPPSPFDDGCSDLAFTNNPVCTVARLFGLPYNFDMQGVNCLDARALWKQYEALPLRSNLYPQNTSELRAALAAYDTPAPPLEPHRTPVQLAAAPVPQQQPAAAQDAPPADYMRDVAASADNAGLAIRRAILRRLPAGKRLLIGTLLWGMDGKEEQAEAALAVLVEQGEVVQHPGKRPELDAYQRRA